MSIDNEIQERVNKAILDPDWPEKDYQLLYPGFIYENYIDESGNNSQRKIGRNCLQNIHTPFDLCDLMLQQANRIKKLRNTPRVLVLCGLEFVDILIRRCGVSPERITFIPDSEREAKLAALYVVDGHQVSIKNKGETLSMPTDKKFDFICGNPPYQDADSEGKTKVGTTLYHKFTEQANKLCDDEGCIVLITPATWMNGRQEHYKEVFQDNDILHLEIGTANKFFPDVGSSFSWFILQKTYNPNHVTDVVSVINNKEVSEKLHLHGLPFMPKLMTREVMSIYRKLQNSDNRFSLIDNYNNDIRNHLKSGVTVTNESDATHKYKIYITGTQIKYTNRPLDGYDQPKIIVSHSGSLRPIWDKGEISVTQKGFTMRCQSENDGKNIVDLLNSKLYRFYHTSVFKWNGFNNLQVINSLPLPKFTNISDEKVYDYFKITEAEQIFIENTIASKRKRKKSSDIIAN